MIGAQVTAMKLPPRSQSSLLTKTGTALTGSWGEVSHRTGVLYMGDYLKGYAASIEHPPSLTGVQCRCYFSLYFVLSSAINLNVVAIAPKARRLPESIAEGCFDNPLRIEYS
jgi:hypothetical protein